MRDTLNSMGVDEWLFSKDLEEKVKLRSKKTGRVHRVQDRNSRDVELAKILGPKIEPSKAKTVTPEVKSTRLQEEGVNSNRVGTLSTPIKTFQE